MIENFTSNISRMLNSKEREYLNKREFYCGLFSSNKELIANMKSEKKNIRRKDFSDLIFYLDFNYENE